MEKFHPKRAAAAAASSLDYLDYFVSSDLTIFGHRLVTLTSFTLPGFFCTLLLRVSLSQLFEYFRVSCWKVYRAQTSEMKKTIASFVESYILKEKKKTKNISIFRKSFHVFICFKGVCFSEPLCTAKAAAHVRFLFFLNVFRSTPR